MPLCSDVGLISSSNLLWAGADWIVVVVIIELRCQAVRQAGIRRGELGAVGGAVELVLAQQQDGTIRLQALAPAHLRLNVESQQPGVVLIAERVKTSPVSTVPDSVAVPVCVDVVAAVRVWSLLPPPPSVAEVDTEKEPTPPPAVRLTEMTLATAPAV